MLIPMQALKVSSGANTESERKLRGAFFTPDELCEFIVDWAIRSGKDSVLDPACGEAVFLSAAGRRLSQLRGSVAPRTQLHGVDIHSDSLTVADRVLRDSGLRASLHNSDFFDSPALGQFDAVIGNPPYVRYQDFNGQARAKAQRAALAHGVHLGGLASSWAAFVVHAATFLVSGGRLGLVLPAELLSVNYATPIRRFLMQRFASVQVVVFERRAFPGVLEEVVLLLAEGMGPTDRFELVQVRDGKDLIKATKTKSVLHEHGGKWISALVDNDALGLYNETLERPGICRLADWGRTALGTVTGANRYFTLSEETRRNFELRESKHVRKVFPPGTRHLKGVRFGIADWRTLRDQGYPVWILYPDVHEPTRGLRDYLSRGEALGVPAAYKCRIRSPWWRPPLIAKPDLFFTYMSHLYPRLVGNHAGVTFLNSMHGVWLHRGRRAIGKTALPLLSLNSLTFLGAELNGRSYGGGILKVEPREAARLPVVDLAQAKESLARIKPTRRQFEAALSKGDWAGVVAQIDDAVLRDGLGMNRRDVVMIQTAATQLRMRRHGRAGRGE